MLQTKHYENKTSFFVDLGLVKLNPKLALENMNSTVKKKTGSDRQEKPGPLFFVQQFFINKY